MLHRALHEIKVDTVGSIPILNIYIFDESTLQQHTIYTLAKLYGTESELRGGRFRNHHDIRHKNGITFVLTLPDADRVGTALFDRLLTWLGEKCTSEWSFDFEAWIEDHEKPATIHIKLFFADPCDAVLCRLTF